MSTYTVNFKLDEDGKWVASVLEVPGCVTQGSDIDEARDRVREALALFITDASKAILVDDFSF